MAYNKKVLSKAVSELGKAKAPAKPRDITVDPMGYWNPANQGQPVRVPGNEITMHNVKAPVWAQPNVGPGVLMEPEKNYNFKGASYVDETQIGRKGGTLKSKKYSKSMSATNKLFAKNKLFKNMKSKIFDPNAEFKSGGSKLGPINLNPNPLSHYELNYGYNLPTEQNGGVHSNPWLYTYNQQSEDREPGQVIGLGADFQHKSGLHGSTNVELPFFNKNAMGNLYSELGYNKRFKNFDADATLKNYTEPGSKFNPSFTTGVGYNKNLGDHINFNAGVNNTMVPGKLFKPGVQAGLTYSFQEGGENEDEYMDLTDEEIQAYRDGGYIVEELPEHEIGGYIQHELVKAQGGLETYSGPKFGLQGPSSPKAKVKKTDTSPSVANAKKLEQFYKLQEQKKQQAAAKQKEIELMKGVPKTQVSDNTRTVTPKQAVSDIKNTAILNSAEYKAQEKAKKDAQAAFEREQWKKYNKASTMEKFVDRTQAALSQPLLMAANAISGDQAYVPGMHEGLMNTESPDYDKWLAATKQTRGLGVNDVFNTFNPGNWGAHSRNEINKGNVASGVTEMGLGLLGLKGLKTASGLVKGSANLLNKAEGKLAKFIPEKAPNVPSAPSTGGGNLNAGFSPELIQGAIGPKNKVIANIADKSYMPFLNKAMNRISPLNWVPGYGKKLEGAIKPLGNVIGNSIENGKLVESKSLFNKAKGLVKKGPDADLTTKVGKTNASDIYSAKIDGSVDGSKIGLGSANQQGFIGRNFRKGNASYPIQNNWGTSVKQVPLTDAGVSLNRRLPFSNRYVPIDKEKLMNNKFQWATTGAGLQKAGEKFGAAALTTGIGAGAIAGSTYDPMSYVKDQDVADQIRLENGDPNDYVDLPTRTEAIMKGATDAMGAPSEYLKEGFIPNIIGATGEAIKGNLKQGGTIEEVWEDELDEHTIALLRKAGYTVEELD